MKLVKTIVMVIMLVGLSSCAQARTDMIGPDGQSPVVNVVRNVREAVVQISVEMVITPRQSIDPFNDPFFRQFFRVPRQQQEQQQQQSQTETIPIGTGFIYEYNADTGEAFIMTNNHVAKNSEQGTLKVALADKKIYDATVVGMDANT
ncbi:MAG: protease degQ, partial [Candidatus Cloacimonetes bacterium]|nr:protease degQ [Candidatus Cloacimonadota bacterium]